MKSPVASGCLACSSVMNLERVTMSVCIFSAPIAPPSPPLTLDIFAKQAITVQVVVSSRQVEIRG